ncbi:MAG: acyltransferase [Actinomycetota bacterium]|nr:acyltransferase [Actinomycetota bacterium]
MSVQPAPESRASLLARGHLPVLDAYRAVAALAVVATHVGFDTGQTLHGLFGAVLSRLDVGVALFFALSGFLLYRPWAVAQETGRSGPRTRGYLWRRGLRILPAYWVVVVVALVVLPENNSASRATWAANLGLAQIYVPDTLAHGLTQMWSLSTEVAFYLALPLFAYVTTRITGRGRSPLLAASVLVVTLVAVNIGWSAWIHSFETPGLRGFWLPNFTSWFAVGIMLAATVAHVAAGRPTPRVARPFLVLADQPGACWTTAGGLILLATTPMAGPLTIEGVTTASEGVTKNLLYAAIIALVLLPATLGTPDGRFFKVMASAPLRRLGDISYGIFLWHLVVLSVVFRVTDRPLFSGGFWPVFLETVLGTVAIAALSWVVLERPVMRLRSRVAVTPPAVSQESG